MTDKRNLSWSVDSSLRSSPLRGAFGVHIGKANLSRIGPHLANGLNVHTGHVNHEAVARNLGYEHFSAEDTLKAA